MFGYVKICKPELKVKDYEIYKGVYCSLCKELGRTFGLPASLILSYDFTFLALLNMAMAQNCPQFNKSRCTFNPFSRCSCCKKSNDFVKLSAYTAVLMFYYKIVDNINDSKFIKKLFMFFMLPFASWARAKAKKQYPEIDDVISEAMEDQRKLEDENCDNIDMSSQPSANALASICGFGEENDEQRRVRKHLGYLLGRYVYIMDAADDLEDDIKTGSYNTFVHRFNLVKGDDLSEARIEIGRILDRTISDIINVYKLLELNRYKEIFDNLIYDGLYGEKQKMFMKAGAESDEQ
ncbi:MAG: DUF5685 family protein [Clostridiales bacterium]|nr:DUF5685 family protein [Clostridiales bacterium]